jgi:hypothetical protein
MPGFRVYYVAVDDDGSESVVAKSFAPRAMEVDDIHKAARDCHDAIHEHTDLGPIDTRYEGRGRNRSDWRPISKELRRGEICFAAMVAERVKEGTPGEDEVRSEMGHRVEKFNKMLPGLNLNLNEALRTYYEIAEAALKIQCRPKADEDNRRRTK